MENPGTSTHPASKLKNMLKSLLVPSSWMPESKNKTSKDQDASRQGTSQTLEFNKGDDEVAEVSNVEFFKSLQINPSCSHFFRTFGNDGTSDMGALVVGRKISEATESELYRAQVTWKDLKMTSRDEECQCWYVLKVFKRGTFLRDLQPQWPPGLWQGCEQRLTKASGGKLFTLKLETKYGTLLEDGRIAVLLRARGEIAKRSLIRRWMEFVS